MSIENDEKRVAHILKVKEDENLPKVSEKTLNVYHHYLNKNLSFPFDAKYPEETGPLEKIHYDIKITDILDIDECSDLEFYGLFCKGKQGRCKIAIPLAKVEMKQKGKNQQLIEDYNMWFWNYR